jgi:hypothetical protein
MWGGFLSAIRQDRRNLLFAGRLLASRFGVANAL